MKSEELKIEKNSGSCAEKIAKIAIEEILNSCKQTDLPLDVDWLKNLRSINKKQVKC